ncbi:hypothetical protein QQF64_026986 [Cirrhinus molitorella]|uniref:Uncharacterized protein n=1 Tax=Cirrhinus molitorella TaxID=172907 RepID=A0ABR3NB44_9TELE
MTEAQKELKLPEHTLITEFPTRWESKEKMIARVLEQAKAVSHVLCSLWRGVCEYPLYQASSPPSATSVLAEHAKDTDVRQELNSYLLTPFTDGEDDPLAW